MSIFPWPVRKGFGPNNTGPVKTTGVKRPVSQITPSELVQLFSKSAQFSALTLKKYEVPSTNVNP